MNYNVLKAELDAGHPVTGAYDADDALAAAELNVVNRTVGVDAVSGSAVFNATDDADYVALTDVKKSRWLGVCAVTSIDVSSGVAKAEEEDIFGQGTTTRTKLAALKLRAVSRAEELGMQTITVSHVAHARTL